MNVIALDPPSIANAIMSPETGETAIGPGSGRAHEMGPAPIGKSGPVTLQGKRCWVPPDNLHSTCNVQRGKL
ncbi:unnamed protein product [Linum trigynum]|uniref:Uncharacterized protein n=1 Tax=Linum trigynum TaxID=586398 RepID=A0AAV2FJI8_9ROSI